MTKASLSGACSSGLVASSWPIVEVRSAPGGAEQNEPAPWVGHTAVSPGNVGEALKRAVLGTGEFLGPVGPEQVRARSGTDDQGSAGEHAERRAAVGQHERQVLVGVSGRGHSSKHQSAQVDLVAVDEASMPELPVPGCRGEHLGAIVMGQLHRPGEEVSVQVGVGNEADAQSGLLGSRPHEAQVPRRVDHQRPTVTEVEHVAGVAQSVVDHRGRYGTRPVAHDTLRTRDRWCEPHAPTTLFHGTLEESMGDRARKAELFEQLARVGKALGSGKRLELLDLLAQGPRSVAELAAAAGLGMTTASAHLQTLKQAGLVATSREGTTIRYRLAGSDVAALYVQMRQVAAAHLADVDAARRSYIGDDDTEQIGRDELLRRAAPAR